MALAQQNPVLIIAPGAAELAAELRTAGYAVNGADASLDPAALCEIEELAAVMYWGGEQEMRDYRLALANRTGKLLPLLSEPQALESLVVERHLCIDTTAAGGNASLIAAGS